MRKLSLLISLLFSLIMNAQYASEITGLYAFGGSAPEGGSHLFVLDDGHFAISYFGGIQIGKWVNTKDNVYKFTHDIQESRFELFGRYNKDLKGKTKILFSGFENGETYIQLRSSKEEVYTMQRVFNNGANCFSPPYVYTFNTIARFISLMSFRFDSNNAKPSIITFENPDGYNDFVANFIEVRTDEAQPFIAVLEDDKLYIEENKPMQRTPLEELGEDVEFIKRMIDRAANRDTLYLNPSYNSFDQADDIEEEGRRDIHEHHVFDEGKNAFIDAEYYVEGTEYNDSEDSYEDMSIIYSYSVLKVVSTKPAKSILIEKPLFEVNCD